jgi:hypothetical protein
MKDFFDRQETARSKTIQLIFLFALSVVLIILCVYIAVTGFYFITILFSFDKTSKVGSLPFWDTGRIIIVFIVTILVILSGSLFKINELKGGGLRVAEMLGGRLVMRNTGDLQEKRLLNVVEEMAIASGVPVPDVYVLDRERGINGFAAGHGIDDAVI